MTGICSNLIFGAFVKGTGYTRAETIEQESTVNSPCSDAESNVLSCFVISNAECSSSFLFALAFTVSKLLLDIESRRSYLHGLKLRDSLTIGVFLSCRVILDISLFELLKKNN
jgi:hypothetical protein